jgi:glycosyltransferase involved in cell wall biosynthesis
VVNDGSSDNTAEVARQFGDKITYIEKKNAGCAARNTGIIASLKAARICGFAWRHLACDISGARGALHVPALRGFEEPQLRRRL